MHIVYTGVITLWCIIKWMARLYIIVIEQETADGQDFWASWVKLEHLGMGEQKFGEVHLIAEQCGIVTRGEPGDESNGTSTACEANLQIKKTHLQQLVKIAVVALFIENNRHPDLNTIVSTILIDTTHIIVALYCAEGDLLFVSDKTKWRHDNKFNLAGIIS